MPLAAGQPPDLRHEPPAPPPGDYYFANPSAVLAKLDARAAAADPHRKELRDAAFIRRFERAVAVSRGPLATHFAAGVAAVRADLSVDAILRAIRERDPRPGTDALWGELSTALSVPLGLSPTARELLRDTAAPLGEFFGLKDSQVAQAYLRAARAVAPLDVDDAGNVRGKSDPGASWPDIAWDPRASDGWEFGVLKAEAIRYVEVHGAQQISGITAETRSALEVLIRRAWEEPTTAGQLQRAIYSLEGPDGLPRIGLNSRQQRLFEKWIDGQISSGSWADWPQAKIQRTIDARFRSLARARSVLIAQTESYEAGNAGQLATWQAQAQQGAIDTAEWVLEWVTRLINVCRRCIAMDGATRRIEAGGKFVSDGTGPKGVETAERPDLHAGGYCQARRMRASLVAAPRVG